MKVIVNRKGFTLVELLAVIAIIGVLTLIVVPASIKIMNDSIRKTMIVQETEVADAALLYLEDYCKNPFGPGYICTLPYVIENGIVLYSGNIDLSTLVSNDYIANIKLRNNECSGYVTITNNQAKAYLSCGDLYTTVGYVG